MHLVLASVKRLISMRRQRIERIKKVIGQIRRVLNRKVARIYRC